MLGTSRPEQATEDGVVLDAEPDLNAKPELDAKPACVALVPVIPSAQWSQNPGQLRSVPNSIFVTQLIATAEQEPQTRSPRRATLADARTAYGANHNPIKGAGSRTRQII
jgi:hypothetical protein